MKPWSNFNNVDIIAVTFIILSAFGMIFRPELDLSAVLALIAGYYFGKKASTLPPDEPQSGV